MQSLDERQIKYGEQTSLSLKEVVPEEIGEASAPVPVLQPTKHKKQAFGTAESLLAYPFAVYYALLVSSAIVNDAGRPPAASGEK